MKIKFFCDSGANIKSMREEIFTLEELGYTEESWKALSDEDKYKEAKEWAFDYLEIGYMELNKDETPCSN